MARTDNFVTLHGRTTQARTIVSANILDREELAIDIENGHHRAVEINSLPAARGDVSHVCNDRPVTHAGFFRTDRQTAMTSSSGSMRRTNPVMPASVPEIELGQLPQAPW